MKIEQILKDICPIYFFFKIAIPSSFQCLLIQILETYSFFKNSIPIFVLEHNLKLKSFVE